MKNVDVAPLVSRENAFDKVGNSELTAFQFKMKTSAEEGASMSANAFFF